MALIKLECQPGFIWRLGKLGVAYFGAERTLCVDWGYVADFRAIGDKAQRKWIELCVWPPLVVRKKWRPM